MIAALIGLDPDEALRAWTQDRLLQATSPSPAARAAQIRFRALYAAEILSGTSSQRLDAQAGAAALLLAEAITATSDEAQLEELGAALNAVAAEIPPVQADQLPVAAAKLVAIGLVNRISTARERDQVRELRWAL